MSAVPSSAGAAQAAAVSDIPSLDRLLNADALRPALDAHGRTQVVAALRQDLDALRQRALQGGLTRAELDAAAVAGRGRRAGLRHGAAPARRAQPDRHRAAHQPGPRAAARRGRGLGAARVDLASQPGVRPDTGGRGDRDDLVEGLLRELTGAEAATVVNNNAAAVLLMLNALADRREVVVSRGELVEIGGAFRIPDIMKRAGAKLIEVGTTNRTHAADYENAIGPRTAMLMKVHCSNYAVTGFTKSVSVAEVAALAHARGLPATVDLGSGTLVDLAQFGLPKEDTVRETTPPAPTWSPSAATSCWRPAGRPAGGPRRPDPQDQEEPAQARAARGQADAGRAGAGAGPVPRAGVLADCLTTLRLLTRPQREIQALAERLRGALAHAAGSAFEVEAVPMYSQIGSGALPVDQLPSYGLAARHRGPGRPGRHLTGWKPLRGLPVPVIGRIADDALWLDLRCLEARDEVAFAAQLAEPIL